MENSSSSQSSKQPLRKNDPVLETKLHLERGSGQMRATYRWFSWKRLAIYLPGTMLLLFFGGILISFGGPIISISREDLLLVVVYLALLVVALWGMYQTIAVLINRTVIDIASGQLSVHHGPLPYRGNRTIQYSELKEIRTGKTSKAGVPLLVPAEDGGGVAIEASFYQLRAILNDGRKVELVYGSDECTIRYLEAAITEQMPLKDFSPAATTDVIPASLEVHQDFGNFQVIYRWFSWKKTFRYLMTVLGGLAIAVLVASFAPHEHPDILAQLAAFICLLLALYGVYGSLATALNRTTIEVSSERLCVRHSPLPYPGNRSVPCIDLQQLVVVERKPESDQPVTYRLDAILKNGETIDVWSNASPEILDYLKQSIERQLARQNLTLKTEK